MITWNVNPEIFSIKFDFLFIHSITLRWYSLLFALSFIVGFQIMSWIYQKEKRNENELNDLLLYMMAGTVIGARLGHCLFYNPSYYLSHPLEILAVWHGGLASHGAAVGIPIVIYLLSKKKNIPYLWILDRIVITVALAGAFIRLGNLINSEIIGIPTTLPWGFIFTSVDNVPRHPAQLYEAIFYLITFFILHTIYKKKSGKLKEGFLLGLFLILVFAFRFFVEFIKEKQTHFEDGLALNMGQYLSIPLVIIGIYLIYRTYKLIK